MGLNDLLGFVPGPFGPILKAAETMIPALFGHMGQAVSSPNLPSPDVGKELLNQATGAALQAPSSYLQSMMQKAGQGVSMHLK